MPITFHRTLHAFIPNMTREHLNHPYITRVELIHGTKLPVREHWEEVVQELAAVGNIPLGPEHEEVINLLSPTTRFLRHLEKDLVPSHFNFTVDSDRDHNFPHSLTQTVTHALRLGNLEPLLTPVTQILTISKERDPNNDTPAPDPPAPELLPSQQLLHGESLERWLEADLHPDLVVLRPFDSTGHILEKYKRQREELEQEEAPQKKRTHKQYKSKKSKKVRILQIIKIFPIQSCCQRGPLVGSPRTLNLDLIPLTKTTKILQKKSQKTYLCTASDLHEKYPYLFRSHQLVAKMILPNSTHS